MVGSTGQRSVDAAFTARLAFRDYGSFGPYGSIDTASERLLRVHLSGIFPGQVPPRGPRPTSITRANFHGVRRCAAAPRPRTLRPSRPASP